MREDQARAGNLRAIRAAAAELRWDTTARKLIELYHLTCDRPPTPAAVRERGEGLMRGDLSEDAIRLLGPEGVLSRDLERPLLALATHPQIGEPVFRAIKAGYRASYRLRRFRGRNGA
jgi:hypothetical protein